MYLYVYIHIYMYVFNAVTVNRRVHITEETLQHLNGAYEVEEGDGASRDSLLTGRKTYLVIDPHKQDSISRRLKTNVSVYLYKIIYFFFPHLSFQKRNPYERKLNIS